jgi:hypothetical protein
MGFWFSQDIDELSALSRSTIDALSLARDIFSSTRRAERPGCPAPHVSYIHLLLLPTPDVFPVIPRCRDQAAAVNGTAFEAGV